MWRGKENKRWFGMMLAIVVCLAGVRMAGAGLPEQQKLLASDGYADDQFGESVSISGAYAVVGAPYDDDKLPESGSAYIFYSDGTSWSEQAKLTASDGTLGDWFGGSVSVSGDYAIVGAPQDDDNGADSGSAYIFKRDGTSWSEQAKLTASDGAAGDYFGYSVSISGDYAIVGAGYDDDSGGNSGSAYIFTPNEVDPNNWDQVAKLLASDGTNGDYFGCSVSISGAYAIVGAGYDDDNGDSSGSAYIFTPNEVDPNNWDQVAKLVAADGAALDEFGLSVSISGDYAVVGAHYDDDKGAQSGSAYIFYYNGTSWSQQDKLLAADGNDADLFGWSVSISGDYAIVGALADDDSGITSGSAYIFKRSGTSWSEQAKLTAADGAAGDRFGYSVAISGGYAIVGACYDDDNGSNSGSAYIYGRLPQIHGAKWYDRDGDGRFVEDTDEGERVMQGWRIYIDVNENGQ
ncbi:MAG: FG-GAP repeat protein, partial [Planctomycetota bacterium]